MESPLIDFSCFSNVNYLSRDQLSVSMVQPMRYGTYCICVTYLLQLYCIVLLYLSRMEFPTVINWPIPFPFQGLLV